MDGAAVLAWCRTRPGATEEQPFGPGTIVFKVGGRMFAACPAEPSPTRVTLKCDPGFARRLRAEHEGITGAYHMNKRHWNTVSLDAGLPAALVEDLLGHSYTLVVDGLPKSHRHALRGRPPD